MGSKTFGCLKENFLSEISYVTEIGTRLFICPFVGRSKNQIRGFYMTCTLLSITILQLIVSLLVTKFENLFEIINIAPNLGVCVLILIKYSKMHKSQRLYEDILNHFKTDIWDVIETESEKHTQILQKYTNVSKKIFRASNFYMILLTLVVILFPRIIMFYDTDVLGNDVQYLYPFDGWYPFDKVKWYYLAYIWESIMTTVVIALFVFANMIHTLFTRNICMELKILGSTIEDLISSKHVMNITKGRSVHQTHESIREKLKIIAKQHQVLTSMASDLEKALGLGMLLIYIFGSVFICLTIFTATVVDNMYMSLRYFSFFCSLLLEVFIQCSIGQMLVNHSVTFERAIYSCSWPYADRDTKRMLFIMLIRAQRPIKFSADGYLTMNLDTFSQVCSMSYQFFNLLHKTEMK